jgi:hypothetical protein
VELENRKAGILPPAFGSGGMLDLAERTWTERPNPLMKFKLFEHENAIGPSNSVPPVPKPHTQATSRSRQKPRFNDNANEDYSDDGTDSTADRIPPLLANDALAQAVSQVQIPMDGWAPVHIYKLFVVLVDPLPGLDLSAVEGLCDYLVVLLARIGGVIENGIRGIVSHCWWALLSKCPTNFSQF